MKVLGGKAPGVEVSVGGHYLGQPEGLIPGSGLTSWVAKPVGGSSEPPMYASNFRMVSSLQAFQPKLFTFFIFPMPAAYFVYLILLDFIILVVSGEEYILHIKI